MALLVMLTESGAAAYPAQLALLVMLAVAGAAAFPAQLAPIVVLTHLPDAPLDWMRHRWFRRCRRCWECLFHDLNGGGSKL